MFFDALFDFAASSMAFFLSLISAVAIPLDLIGVLSTITGYGSFILGADLLLVIFGVCGFFILLRLGIAIATFALSLVPTMSPK